MLYLSSISNFFLITSHVSRLIGEHFDVLLKQLGLFLLFKI